MYPDYLVHYNKNHSKSNGQFVSGDGDGDGQVNDNQNQQNRKKGLTGKQKAGLAFGIAGGLTAIAVAGGILASKLTHKSVYDPDEFTVEKAKKFTEGMANVSTVEFDKESFKFKTKPSAEYIRRTWKNMDGKFKYSGQYRR